MPSEHTVCFGAALATVARATSGRMDHNLKAIVKGVLENGVLLGEREKSE